MIHLTFIQQKLIAKSRIAEITAVVFNLLYTFFYLRQNPWCFLFGIISPLLFLIITFRAKLYADVLLQIFYFGITVYGFWNWGGEWKTNHITYLQNLLFFGGAVGLTFILGSVLRKNTDAKMPFTDSFVTSLAIVGTWLMMNFVHENWLYFILVNSISIFLFSRRKLYWSAIMFAIYLLMSIDGYFMLNWFTFGI